MCRARLVRAAKYFNTQKIFVYCPRSYGWHIYVSSAFFPCSFFFVKFLTQTEHTSTTAAAKRNIDGVLTYLYFLRVEAAPPRYGSV